MTRTRRRVPSPFNLWFFDSMLARVLGEILPSGAQRKERRHSRHVGDWGPPAKGAKTAKKRRRGLELEPLEPRLLMSVDALAFSGAGAFTLSATSAGALNILDNAHNLVASTSLVSGAQTVTIQRGSGSDTPGGDILHVNLDTFSALDNTIGAGNTLTLKFISTDQSKDQIVLDGTNPNNATPGETIHYGMAVNTDSQITSSGAATVQGNLTLQSSYQVNSGIAGTGLLANANTGITLTGANFKTLGAGNNITLEASSTLDVANTGTSTTAPSSLTGLESTAQSILSSDLGSLAASAGLPIISSYSSAPISITGGSVLNSAGDLDITSTVSGSLTGSADGLTGFDVAILVGGRSFSHDWRQPIPSSRLAARST